MNDTPLPDTLITDRSQFDAALRSALGEAAAAGARELRWCDEDFAAWPIGERAVVEQLTRWAASSRRLTVIARSFDEIARRHPRWVEWRRNWAHIVDCRANLEIATGEFPTVLLAAGTVSLRLSDTFRHRGRLDHGAAEATRCRETFDAVLQRSVEAFPATTTGL